MKRQPDDARQRVGSLASHTPCRNQRQTALTRTRLSGLSGHSELARRSQIVATMSHVAPRAQAPSPSAEEEAIYRYFQQALRLLSQEQKPTEEEVLWLESQLRPYASLQEIREVVVDLCDRTQCFTLAALWDQEQPTQSSEHALARVQRLLELGAPALALNYLRRLPAEFRASNEVCGVLQAAAASDSAERALILEKNLRALAGRDETLACAIQQTETTTTALRPIGAGLALDCEPCPLVFTFEPTVKHARTRALSDIASMSKTPHDLAIIGVGDCVLLASYIGRLPELGAGLGKRYAVRIVEPDLARVRALLEVAEMSLPLAEGRFVFHAGDTCYADFGSAIVTTGNLVPRLIFLDTNDDMMTRARATKKKAETFLRREWEKLNQTLNGRRDEVRERWRLHLRDGAPLRILLPISNATTYLRFGSAAVASALRALGHEVITASDKEGDAYWHLTDHSLARHATEVKADAIFTLNQTRLNWSRIAPELPFVTWNMDGFHDLKPALAEDAVGAHDHVLALSPDVPVELGWPEKQAHPFVTAFNHEVFSAGAHVHPDACLAEVGYISNFYGTPEFALKQLVVEAAGRKDYPERFEQAARLVSAHQGELPPLWSSLRTCFETDDPDEVVELKRLADIFFIRFVNPWYRQRCLLHLAEAGVDLALFGNLWEKHPVLRKFARGPLEGPHELVRGYRSTKLQLQLMLGSSLHQRLADGAALGVPLVVRRFPTDFAGRVRLMSPTPSDLKRPAAMNDAEWEFLLDKVDQRGERDSDGSKARQRELGLKRIGVAIDEVIEPSVLDQVSAGSHQGTCDLVAELLSAEDARQASARALHSQVMLNLNPETQLKNTLQRIAAVEASTPEGRHSSRL